jgi:hypothetical protein
MSVRRLVLVVLGVASIVLCGLAFLTAGPSSEPSRPYVIWLRYVIARSDGSRLVTAEHQCTETVEGRKSAFLLNGEMGDVRIADNLDLNRWYASLQRLQSGKTRLEMTLEPSPSWAIQKRVPLGIRSVHLTKGIWTERSTSAICNGQKVQLPTYYTIQEIELPAVLRLDFHEEVEPPSKLTSFLSPLQSSPPRAVRSWFEVIVAQRDWRPEER